MCREGSHPPVPSSATQKLQALAARGPPSSARELDGELSVRPIPSAQEDAAPNRGRGDGPSDGEGECPAADPFPAATLLQLQCQPWCLLCRAS